MVSSKDSIKIYIYLNRTFEILKQLIKIIIYQKIWAKELHVPFFNVL